MHPSACRDSLRDLQSACRSGCPRAEVRPGIPHGRRAAAAATGPRGRPRGLARAPEQVKGTSGPAAARTRYRQLSMTRSVTTLCVIARIASRRSYRFRKHVVRASQVIRPTFIISRVAVLPPSRAWLAERRRPRGLRAAKHASASAVALQTSAFECVRGRLRELASLARRRGPCAAVTDLNLAQRPRHQAFLALRQLLARRRAPARRLWRAPFCPARLPAGPRRSESSIGGAAAAAPAARRAR